MKNFYKLKPTIKNTSILLLFFALFINSVFGQSMANYQAGFTASSGTYTPITGGTTVPTIQVDGAISAAIPIGFDFWYMGQKYTDIKASSDGFISFNMAATNSLTNDLPATAAVRRPLIAPLWDDLDGTPANGGEARYQVLGTAPNRVFVFQWSGWQWNYLSTLPVIAFQAHLYETTGKIEFVYDTYPNPTTGTPSASIGLAATATGAGNYVVLTNSSASPAVITTTNVTTINTKPASGQIYTFLPPSPLAATSFLTTVTSATQIDLSWADNATNEILYMLQYSTDPAFSTSTTLTYTANTTSASITGLLPNTAYYFNLYPILEVPGTAVSTNATTPDIPKTINSFTVTQASAGGVDAGTVNKPVLLTHINVIGSLGTLPFNSFAASSLNTSDADISAIKLYVTTNTTFATTTLLASTTSFSSGVVSFLGVNYELQQGDNYFWLTYDIAPTAVFGNIIDAQIDANFIDINGNPYPASTENPSGMLWIDQLIPGPFTYDFESGEQGFTHGIVTGTIDEWEHGIPVGGTNPPPGGAHSPVNCWGTNIDGNYIAGTITPQENALYSPVYSAIGSPVSVSYWEYFRTGGTPTKALQYSINGGAWTNILSTTTNVTVWTEVLPQNVAVNIGDQIQFRWKFNTTTGSGANNGWYVDDVTVTNVNGAASTNVGDNVAPTIVYTPLSNDVVSTSRVLTAFADITDNSGGTGIDVTPGNRPRVYYKKSTEGPGFDPLNDNTVDGWKWVESTNTTTPFDFTIDYNKLMSPVVDGEVIQYFVVAQDSLRYPAFPAGGNVSSNVAGGFVGTSVSDITVAPTTPLTYLIAPVIGPVTYTISSTGDYASITNSGGLFEAINNSVVAGDITAIITEDISGETGDNSLNVFGNGLHKLKIIADGTGLKTISGNSTANPNGMIRFNGASHVLVDGGTNKNLTFINDATNSAVFSFMNDCSNDSITNVTIEGSLTNANSGLILIGTGYQVGNKNLSFTNNTIKENSLVVAPYSNGIYSQGSSASISNEMIVIQNNDFVNFATNGINVTATGNGNNWKINSNNFYTTDVTTLTTAVTAINFKSGNSNNEITGNTIGGSAPSAGGVALATTANFTGMDIVVSTDSLSTVIKNNTIKNIRSTVATSALNSFVINITAGSVLVRNNTVGSDDVNERIELNGNNKAINVVSDTWCVIDSNLVANITSTSNGIDDFDRFAIFADGTGNFTVNNNIIHDIANTEKEFGTATALTYAMVVGTTGTANIIGNTVYNIANTNTNTGITNFVAGIDLEGTVGLYNVLNNKVYNISSSSVATTTFNQINGIQQLTGLANIANNTVSIKDNSFASVRGVLISTTVSSNLAYNTIYLSGATEVDANSFGILRTSAATMALRNNLIYNGRTINTGAAKHFALGSTNATPTDGWSLVSSSNNAIVVGDLTAIGQWNTAIIPSTDLGFTFGEIGSKVLATSDILASDLFVNAGGATPNLNIDETKMAACLIANIGTQVAIGVDIENETRSTTTPDPGAYEFDGLLPGTVSPIVGPLVGCAGSSPINFSVNTVTNATEYIWSFTNGITMSSTGIPSEAIQVNVAPGTTSGGITVTAKNGCGISNNEFKLVEFDNNIPVANFNSSTAAAGVAVELFTSTSTDATSYDWNFGDGNTSTLESPAHSYTANGPFTVTLTVSNACGTDTETKTVQFTVGSQELVNNNVSMVSPNPTADKFVLVHNSTTDKTITVEVSNIAGQTVYSHNVENYTGSYKQEISLSGNANGVYFVKVISDNNTTTHKLILNN